MAADHAVTVRPGTAADVKDALTIENAADAQRSGRAPSAGESRDRKRRRLAFPDTFFFIAQSTVGNPIALQPA